VLPFPLPLRYHACNTFTFACRLRAVVVVPSSAVPLLPPDLPFTRVRSAALFTFDAAFYRTVRYVLRYKACYLPLPDVCWITVLILITVHYVTFVSRCRSTVFARSAAPPRSAFYDTVWTVCSPLRYVYDYAFAEPLNITFARCVTVTHAAALPYQTPPYEQLLIRSPPAVCSTRVPHRTPPFVISARVCLRMPGGYVPVAHYTCYRSLLDAFYFRYRLIFPLRGLDHTRFVCGFTVAAFCDSTVYCRLRVSALRLLIAHALRSLFDYAALL